MFTRSTLAVVVSVALASCGGVSASDCVTATTAQAAAEREYIAMLSLHDEAHAAGNDDHADVDDETVAARANLVVATEAAARACRSRRRTNEKCAC